LQLVSKAIQGLRQNFFGRFETGIWVLTGIHLLSSISFAICLPFLALYLYQIRGLSMTMVGMGMVIAGICGAASQVVGGWLSDKFGRRPVLVVSVGIRILFFSGLTVLIGVSAPTWAIIVVYIAGRAAGAAVRPITSAMVADLSPKERLTETYGLLRIGGNVGFAAGPALGGYLATFLPYAWLFGVAALVSILTFCLILFFLRESLHGTTGHVDLRSMFSVASDRTFMIFIVISLLLFLGASQLMSTLSVFTVDRMGFSTAQYGLLLTMNGLIVVLFQYQMARGIGRLSKTTALILGCIIYGFGYLSLGWIESFNWALVAIAITTVGEIIFSPTALSVVGELSPRDRRGRYMGFFGLSEMLGISGGPLVGGILLDAFPTDARPIWGTISFLSFASAVAYYLWGKRYRSTSAMRIGTNA